VFFYFPTVTKKGSSKVTLLLLIAHLLVGKSIDKYFIHQKQTHQGFHCVGKPLGSLISAVTSELQCHGYMKLTHLCPDPPHPNQKNHDEAQTLILFPLLTVAVDPVISAAVFGMILLVMGGTLL